MLCGKVRTHDYRENNGRVERGASKLVEMGEADIADRDKLREILAKIDGGEG